MCPIWSLRILAWDEWPGAPERVSGGSLPYVFRNKQRRFARMNRRRLHEESTLHRVLTINVHDEWREMYESERRNDN